MTRYYFDFHSGDDIVRDEEGMEFHDFGQVQAEAARSLAEMTKQSVFDNPEHAHLLAIDVRDKTNVILRVRFSFERTDNRYTQ